MFQPYPVQGGTATADPQVAGLNGQSRVPEMFGNVIHGGIPGTIPGTALPYNGFSYNPFQVTFGGQPFNPFFNNPGASWPTAYNPSLCGPTCLPGTMTYPTPFVNTVPTAPFFHPFMTTPTYVPTPGCQPTYWNNPLTTPQAFLYPGVVNPFVPAICPTPSPLAFNPFWATNPTLVNWTGMAVPQFPVNPNGAFSPNVIPPTINPFTGLPIQATGWNPYSFRGIPTPNGYSNGTPHGFPAGSATPFATNFGFQPTYNPYAHTQTYEGLIGGFQNALNPHWGATPWGGLPWNTPNFFSTTGFPSNQINTSCGTNPPVAFSTNHPITGIANPFFSPTQVTHGIPGFGHPTTYGGFYPGVATNPLTGGISCN